VGLVAASLQIALPASAGVDRRPGQTGFEPTTAVVNPRNPSQVAVMRGCQVRISNNFGQSWPITRNTTGGCNGDPVIAFDSQDRLFVTHLDRVGADTELSVFVGQITDTTTPGTATYTPVQVSADDGNADDKQWLVADTSPVSPYRDNLYIVWSLLPNAAPSQILFSRSTDSGTTWSAPAVVSANGEGFVWPSHAAVGPNGDVYVAYHTDTCGGAGTGSIHLLRDGFGGQNLAAGSVLQKTTPFPAGQGTVTCNVQDNSGDEIAGTDFWLQGSMQPWVLPDPARAGHVYVVANDDPNDAFGNGDDADVMIARSRDLGATFTRGRVDHGPGQSFAVMPTAHIDQDGNIAVTWYDNRSGLTNGGTGPNGADNFLLDVYGTASIDGGLTFANDFRINDAAFDPDVGGNCRFGPVPPCQNPTNPATTLQTQRIGEYNGVWTVDGIGYAVWTGNNAPPPGATAPQTTFFDVFSLAGAFPDRFEPNESVDFPVVATLGSDNTYNQARLSLHSATDRDMFRIVALHTGTLSVDIEFNEQIANLTGRALDDDGTPVETTDLDILTPGSSIASFTIPVVAGRTYFVEVRNSAPLPVPPHSTYNLAMVNRPAPVPFGIDMDSASDSGVDNSDNLTNDTTPSVRVRVDMTNLLSIPFSPTDNGFLGDDLPGYKVEVYENGNSMGFASQVVGQLGVFELTPSAALADGPHSLTARVLIVDPSMTAHYVGRGGESNDLVVTIDSVAPSGPAAPDLLAASDTGGVDIDDITTLRQPALGGTAEVNTLVRVLANGAVVGQGPVGTDSSDGISGNGLGRWEITTQPLNDGVYQMTATSEDRAGNASAPAGALRVTVANQVLNLSGATADVVVDLGAGTVTSFNVPGGLVGIIGIPTVNINAGGHHFSVLGTGADDALQFTPTGAQSGRVTRAGSAQVLVVTNVLGAVTIDPLGGTDSVQLNGTSSGDSATVVLDTMSVLGVNGLQAITSPTANAEQFALATGLGADDVSVTAFDTVNALLTVDADLPTSSTKKADSLTVAAGSPKGKVGKMPSPVKGGGSLLVSYPQTTGNQSRVDYIGVESIAFAR
jgi:hypothetical protein